MSAPKAVSTTLPGGTKVTCSEEQAKRYAAESAPTKAPAKRAAAKSSDEK